MKQSGNNFAFIDSQNLNLGVMSQGWRLDFGRFRKYLEDKYAVRKAYLFIGYLPGNESLYSHLQQVGYICIFKPTLELRDGTIKGNVDAELVLHAMIQYDNFDQAVIVTGDGDFFCLVQHFLEQGKLLRVLVPNQYRYSGLLKRLSTPGKNIFDFVTPLRRKLEYRPIDTRRKK
jgi:uncharacterized LabA/DUF88 family protein